MVAAKLGGADPAGTARLAAVIEKARKTKRLARCDRARQSKRVRVLAAKSWSLEQLVFEGYAPHKVPVIVEVPTDNKNRTAPEIRVLFKRGQLGAPGSNKFLFDHVGLVEAHHPDAERGCGKRAAIEAGAQDLFFLTNADDAEIPEETRGARFITAPTDLHAVSPMAGPECWTIVTSELGYIAKTFPELSEEDREQVGEFLQAVEDHDDVHRVWAAIR